MAEKSFLTMIITIYTTFTIASANSIRGGYYPSWAQSSFPPSAIKTHLFTHLYYAFLSPDAVSFQFNIPADTQLLLTNFTAAVHASRRRVKALFSVGGASEGAALFSRMASTSSSRAAFIRSSIQTARRFGFDGVDLDWEFPEDSGDMRNLGLLLQEWRVEVEKDGGGRRPPLLLTAAVYYSADAFLSGAARAYPVDSIVRNLDWINVMNYDYRGAWDTAATGAHAALFDPRSNLSTSFGLGSWIRVGVPKSKIIMGLPLYGRTWRLRDRSDDGVGAPAVGVGPGEGGVLTYAEVVRFNREEKAKVAYDRETVSAYSVAGTSWVGYDDAMVVTVKARYARRLGLRGYFFWAISYDHNWTLTTRAALAWSV
ncbi:nod factor hydrolase protein 1-like [Andrographis paniculata]|uniref:nod factor hydrolase protein 1-like n=1 Tax=Andrographis paniculata TaxID=175694 RepID=UPI0021E75924|nr:nod factor hydrolase protein 1-like [Andrographis paniculata]